jgi:prevent-host-death family protein
MTTNEIEKIMKLAAANFKAKCLKLMDYVNQSHEEVIITKHGKPVAKLVPYSQAPEKPLFGFMKGTVKVNGDIIASIDEEWEVDSE